MERTQVIEKIKAAGFEVKLITLIEDGYEILILPHGEPGKLWEIVLEGFKIVDVITTSKTYKLLIIPITFNEMIDFVWTYIEKNGRKDEPIEDALLEAVTVLERIVDNSNSDEAKKNFEAFASQIF